MNATIYLDYNNTINNDMIFHSSLHDAGGGGGGSSHGCIQAGGRQFLFDMYLLTFVTIVWSSSTPLPVASEGATNRRLFRKLHLVPTTAMDNKLRGDTEQYDLF